MENETVAIEIQQPTPMAMLQMAVSQGADIDKLSKLMDLQERWQANEARKAYVAAMNAFKVNPPKIVKNKTVSFKETKYNHATLDNVCDVIGSALSKHGLSYRWETQQTDVKITVTCIVTHEDGHSEKTTLSCLPDATGSKNAIQAIGSAVTYLQRYTLLAITGMATEEQDNDGASLPDDRIAEQLEWIANASSMSELQKLFKNAYQEAATVKDQSAMAAYIEAKDNRKAELA